MTVTRLKRQFTTVGATAFFIVITALSGISYAQTLHVGKGHNGNGGVRFEATEFGAPRFPIILTILFHNGRVTINQTKLTFIIEKLNTEGASPEVIFVRVPQGRNWLSTDYSFVSSGEYRITAFDPDNKSLANATVVIKAGDVAPVETAELKTDQETVKAEEAKSEATETAQVSESGERSKIDLGIKTGEQMPDDQRKLRYEKAMADTVSDPLLALAYGETVDLDAQDIAVLNFDKATMKFGTGITKDQLAGEATEFGFDAKGRYVQIFLDNGSPLATDRLVVDVWMRTSADQDYDQHIGRKEVGINPKMARANFHFSFFKQGEHKVSVYTRDMVWVCNGYLSIK
jgi:hypothetical protein